MSNVVVSGTYKLHTNLGAAANLIFPPPGEGEDYRSKQNYAIYCCQPTRNIPLFPAPNSFRSVIHMRRGFKCACILQADWKVWPLAHKIRSALRSFSFFFQKRYLPRSLLSQSLIKLCIWCVFLRLAITFDPIEEQNWLSPLRNGKNPP